MELSQYNMHAPNMVCICVDRMAEQEYSGEIWHQYSAVPVSFGTTVGLIQELDRLYDRWDFPQRSTNVRTFDPQAGRTPAEERERGRGQMDERRLNDRKGNIGTFLVRVKYRQNATWQGEVVWVEKNRKQYFRSALELLKLIDGALGETPDMENAAESS